MVYDIVFLGGGPAGYEGAIAAAKKGLKTAVIEKQELGGVCLHRGCIPTKTLLHSVKFIKQIRDASKWGIHTGEIEIETRKMLDMKNRVVSKLTRGIDHLFKQNQVELIKGIGKIIAPDKMVINEELEINSRNIVIATGSKPAGLPFLKFDNQMIIHSDTALELNDIPAKLLVIGAGAIGLEMGIIYGYLGAEVTVVEILDYILPGTDTELSGILLKELKKQGIAIHTSTGVEAIRVQKDGIHFSFKQDQKVWEDQFQKVLVSVGRTPVTDQIFAGSLDIKKDPKGYISVNKNLQTDVETIFACGDVVGPPLLAHKASHQAMAIVDFITEKKKMNHLTVPSAVFTFPEIASVGLTENEANQRGIKIKIARFPYSAGSRSNAIDDKQGLVKVVTDLGNTIIGAHIVGSEAAELMPLLTHAVSHQMKAGDFKELVFIHPTLGENIWEALGSVGNFSIHI